jgi:hypothetical protein
MPSVIEDEFYSLTPMEDWVVNELKRRQGNIGLTENVNIINDYANFVNKGAFLSLDTSDSDFSYAGPKTAWIRLVSNAEVKRDNEKNSKIGFQLFSKEGFEKIYGFTSNTSSDQIGRTVLGYDVKGNPHTLEGTYFSDGDKLHVPPPGVQSLQTEMLGGDGGKFRKATIKMVVPSLFQLDYITPYFLIPGITCVVEWGWNNFNPVSLLDIADVGQSRISAEEALSNIKASPASKAEISKRYNDPTHPAHASTKKKIEERRTSDPKGIRGRLTDYNLIKNARKDSLGNYDSMIGKITNYSYNLRGDGGYDVTLELLQAGEAMYGLQTAPKAKRIDEASKKEEVLRNIKDFFETDLKDAIKESDINKPYTFFANQKTGDSNAVKGIAPIESSGRILNAKIVKSAFDSVLELRKDDVGWIRFDLFIQLLNIFSARVSSVDPNIQLFKININDSYITAHPNLKSTNGSILLIPNTAAPSYNFRIGSTSNDEKFLSDQQNDFESANEALKQIIESTNDKATVEDIRVDIAKFISINNKVDVFPSLEDLSVTNGGVYGPRGYYGKIGNLYISVDLINKVFSNTEKMLDALKTILDEMSGAAVNIWDFVIRAKDKNADALDLSIVDKNFSTNIDQFRDKPLFTFNPIDNKSIVKNLTFGISLPDSVALQTVYGDNSTVETTREEGTFYSKIRNQGATIQDRTWEDVKPLDTSNDNGEVKKNRIQTGNVSFEKRDYTLVEHTKKSKDNKEVAIQLDEPNVELVKAAITADRNPNNNAIFNGLVPGVEVELEILGLSGIRFLDVFRINGIPRNYADNALFQVKNVRQQLSDNIWSTYITAGLRPFPNVLAKEKENKK